MLKRSFLKTDAFVAMLLAALAMLAPLGCDSAEPWQQPGPEESFERFLSDWYRGDRQAAFEAIDPEDRQRLLEPLGRLHEVLDEEHLPDDSDMLVAGRVDNPYDVAKIEVDEPLETRPQEGQEVTLRLTYHDGRQGEAIMKWGGQRWYVDLPLSARDEAASPQTDESDEADEADEDAGPVSPGEADADDDDISPDQRPDQAP